MFYLLISLIPQNCAQPANLWLYGATLFYWVITLLPKAVPIEKEVA